MNKPSFPLSIGDACTGGQLKLFPLVHTLYRADPCQYLSQPVQRHRTPLTLLPPHKHSTFRPHLSCLRRRRDPIRNLWFHLRHHPQQLFNNLISRLAPRLFDFLQLLFRFSISVFFSFLVAACMLPKPHVSINALTHSCVIIEDTGASHLLLEFFEFVVFLLSVFFNLFLSFALGVFDSFRTVWEGWLGEGRGCNGRGGTGTFSR